MKLPEKTVLSGESSAARCTHFGTCGGCQTQDIVYATQLDGKRSLLQEIFAEFWPGPIEIAASPKVWHYRNRMDFNFGLKRYPEPPPAGFARETVLGFTRKGKWYWPIDVEACMIAPERTGALLEAVRSWYRSEKLRAFDSRSKEGLLRVLLVRESARTGQRMVIVVTSAGDFPGDSFVEAVRSAYPASGILRGISHGLARGAFLDETELLWGAGKIEEVLEVPTNTGLRSLRFQISPSSFFQTNTYATEVLYGEIRRWVADRAPTILYDLYGGSGGIALACSDLVDLARSVESVEEATADGIANAAMNSVENVFFTTAKIETYLLNISEGGGMEPNSVAVLDPPRAGLHPKALKRLLLCRPPHILYVSCKPTVLATDLPVLLEAYTLTGLRAVDLFPHTEHVEVLASLELKR